MSLISSSENIKRSYVYIGYLILQKLKKNNRTSIFEVNDYIKKYLVQLSYRELLYSILFLYSIGAIEMDELYLYAKN